MVYFVQGVDTRRIKIGTSTRDWKERFANMSLSEVVVCLRIAPGGYAHENSWHRRHRAAHFHGEWFTPTPDLMADIESLEITPEVGETYAAGQGPQGSKAAKARGGFKAKRHDCIDCTVGKTRNPGRRCTPCAMTYLRANPPKPLHDFTI